MGFETHSDTAWAKKKKVDASIQVNKNWSEPQFLPLEDPELGMF